MNGWKFRRGLDDPFVDALAEFAKGNSWFADVLKDPDLFIGVRHNYLNVYSKGQSLFKTTWSPTASRITVTTHVKYLVDPKLNKQINLTGAEFDIACVKPLADRYEGAATLKRMKQAAAYYSGDEKIGLHDIVKQNPHIIDLEVALSEGAEKNVALSTAAEEDGTAEESSRSSAPRIDAACLEEINGKIHLCFWEAKDYKNAALWSTTAPPVVDQVEKYRALVHKYKDSIQKSYQRVADNLQAIADLAGRREQISPLVIAVANGRELVIDNPAHIGVIVFGYSLGEKEGGRHKSMCGQIERAGLALATRGSPHGFKLPSAMPRP